MAMATLEMVEKLRQRANVNYDEAKAALEACGDDLLEAMIYLEKQGKVAAPQHDGCYSTQQEPGAYTGQRDTAAGEPYSYGQPRHGLGQALRRFGDWLLRLFHKGNTNYFEVRRRDVHIMTLPVTVLVFLGVFCCYVVVPLLIIGLFAGCKYRFLGPELEQSRVNSVMSTVAETADDLKNQMLNLKTDTNGQDSQQ